MSSKFEPDSLIQALATAIRQRRKRMAVSQEDLSYDAGFARSYLSDVERGGRSLSIKNLTRLANCLNVRPSFLLKIAEDSISDDESQSSNPAFANHYTMQALEHLADCAGDPLRGLLITDYTQNDNPIIFASPAFVEFTGYSAHEIIGHNCRFLQQKNHNQPGAKVLASAVRTGAECNTVIKNYKKDGTPFLNHLTLSPISDTAGAIIGILGQQRFCDAPSSM